MINHLENIVLHFKRNTAACLTCEMYLMIIKRSPRYSNKNFLQIVLSTSHLTTQLLYSKRNSEYYMTEIFANIIEYCYV